MKTRKFFSMITDITAIFLFTYLLIYPQYATEPTRYALEFCAKTLIPSLFIYMVLAKIVITLPITKWLIKIFGLESVVLITGTLCGCPVGAKTAVTLYESKKITKKHAEYLCSFTNNASLSFVLGFVGKELFGDIRVGLRLMIYQLIASAATALFMKFILFGKEKIPSFSAVRSEKTGLREAVADSAMTMINLCACVVFFMVAGGVISHLANLTPFWEAILKSLLEFSSGCAEAIDTGKYAIPITAFALSQTGFSVALQVRSVISGKLAFMPYLTGKVISCIIMTGLAIIFG